MLSITDLSSHEAIAALREMRSKASEKEKATIETDHSVLREVARLTGGRLAYISKAARAQDMLEHTQQMLDSEQAWMLDQIGLIPDHDDDVMDEVCIAVDYGS